MKGLLRTTADIFRYIWYMLNFIRAFILNFALLVVFIFVGKFISHMNRHNVINVIPVTKGALKLDLRGVIVDKLSGNSYISKIENQILSKINKKYDIHQNLLFDLVRAIRQAKDDDNITGIVLDLQSFLGADQVSLQYLGKTLTEFRSAGKPVYATGNNYNQSQYYLASFANKIYLSPLGAVDLRGFATNTLYYHSLLKRLKITPHVFRVGTYKSAVEPFLSDKMSDKVRQADNQWINTIWKNYLSEVAYNRNVDVKQVFPSAQKIISKLKKFNGDTAKYALDRNLVDYIASQESIEKVLEKKFGYNSRTNQYYNTSIYSYRTKVNNQKPNIAVIMINGPIVNNVSNPNSFISNNIIDHIKNVRLNPNIKSVILYVNSPGGSVLASEVIRQELLALHRVKPIVVSMGNIAASGGYWISTPADYIIANPNTLTGSIGIFGLINTVEKSLDIIGIHADGVSTSPFAKTFITQPLPKEVHELMQLSIQKGYDRFVNLVAHSRKKTFKQIDALAQGRIWVGTDAKQNGLVDALGDFDDAVKKAQELGNVTNPKLIWYQDNSTIIDLMSNNASISNILFNLLKDRFNTPIINNIAKQYNFLDNLDDPQNQYAFCLNCNIVNQ
ncbi:signal peptide peptidase SppA [Candidatus Pantoea edessiphila]|uniref:Signal peptide peptidase SppA n=1 Tax=Candidatus Pantoea edessiphila TaxID=2044610 RepID=A0A2P5SYN4_9GAMM|nr:signal peptide peptidase SppA [Candidatus Pantoea edessiphila]MBK4775422.1 signal peptide peptidase SppA [Pantoea sp. Edef]PPI87448.1 signal peptide peptidase SppA [Candidatus Pantoea edessiphila]